MTTEVVMPQMGESIAEGTIVRWMKKVGDRVDRDEPLFEISTDKVDTEIPAPAAGVVAEIRAGEGETVPVNTVVAVIAGPSEAKPVAPLEEPVQATPAAPPVSMPSAPSPARPPAGLPPAAPRPQAPKAAQPAGLVTEEMIRQRSSPLVRRMAEEHHIDISQIQGTGIGGRVTKQDILAALALGTPGGAPRAAREEGQRLPAPPLEPGAADTIVQMSPMRKRIAEHMIVSRRTSAHVHSVFEVNFSRLVQIRDAKKSEYERAGVKLTYLSFIVRALAGELRAMPVVNASIDGEHIVFHKDVNIGIAVALDWGLIVPVVRKADEQDLVGLSRTIADLAARARAKQLKPEEVAGGTFTVTNPGALGALFGMPIINQPQVAILGVGAVEKRPVVVDDAMAIRPMAYLTLGYDHRLIDGAVADQFMSRLKHALETWDPAEA